MDGLIAVIFALCAGSSGVQSEDYMIRCFDYYTNCIVGKGGKIDPKSVKECKEHLPKDLQ